MDTYLIQGFNTDALYKALDVQRIQHGLSWNAVAKEIWGISSELNKERPDDHPFSASTIKSMKEKRRTSCQHAMFMLRWLNKTPECFLEKPSKNATSITLPEVGPHRRLRMSLKILYKAANEKRQQEHLTWAELATILSCKPNQLTRLHTAKYATNMDLAMRIVQWTGKQSIDFQYAAKW